MVQVILLSRYSSCPFCDGKYRSVAGHVERVHPKVWADLLLKIKREVFVDEKE